MSEFLKDKQDIIDWLESYNVTGYSVQSDTKYGWSVSVEGNLNLREIGARFIPVKFNYVSGDLDIRFNFLTSLEFCPMVVGGSFIADKNFLTNLIGAPAQVHGHNFSVDSNILTSLVGCPSRLKNASFAGNLLLSLDGAPQYVEGDFNCHANKLTSLIGGPVEVGGEYNCVFNYLANLKGAPVRSRSFLCFWNWLTTLEGDLKSVETVFSCRNNSLLDLKGGPKRVGLEYDCRNNYLTSLEGMAMDMQSVVKCDDNPELGEAQTQTNPEYFRAYLEKMALVAQLSVHTNRVDNQGAKLGSLNNGKKLSAQDFKI